MTRKRELRVNLKGGLGNQLFGYFAALHLSELTSRKLILLRDEVDLARTNYKYDISSFELNQRVELRKSLISNIKIRLVRKVTQRAPAFSMMLESITRIVRDDKYDKALIERKLQKESKRRTITLEGYFQDISYFFELDLNLRELHLREKSKWFSLMEKKIQEMNPVVIHVRLGDYLENLEAVGVLGGEYYLSSLERIPNYSEREIWVFSDDIEKARKLLQKVDFPECLFVSPPDANDPAESLILMSLAKDLILSNSTFSVWAGLLGKIKSSVFIPEVFFKGNGYTPKHLPKFWILEQPRWLAEKL